MYLPIGLFGVSIATAVLPSIARHAAPNDRPAMRDDVSQALRMMLMLNVPATFGLIALAVPITELLVEYRRMTPADTLGVAAALMGYAPGLVGYSAVKIASPTFYALKGLAHAGRRQRRVDCAERRAQPAARAGDELSRAGARHGPRRAVQRGRCCSGCCAGGSAASTDGG